MITVIKSEGQHYGPNRFRFIMVGLSSEKPIEKHEGVEIVNGSIYTEADTGKTYIYNEAAKSWTEKTGGGGGGGSIKDLDGDGIPDDIATQDDIDDIIGGIYGD